MRQSLLILYCFCLFGALHGMQQDVRPGSALRSWLSLPGGQEPSVELIKRYLNKGLLSNINKISKISGMKGWTLLHAAYSDENIPVLIWLEENGAKKNITNDAGQLPRDMATSQTFKLRLSLTGLQNKLASLSGVLAKTQGVK